MNPVHFLHRCCSFGNRETGVCSPRLSGSAPALPVRWLSALPLALLAATAPGAPGVVEDSPFPQAVAVRITIAPELRGATFQKLGVESDGIVYVLTDRGVARVFETTLALDRSFRPLAGKLARDLALHRGRLFYLYDDRFLCNAFAGEREGALPNASYQRFAVADNGVIALAGVGRLALFRDGQLSPLAKPLPALPTRLLAVGNEFFAVADGAICRIGAGGAEVLHRDSAVTALASEGPTLWLGTRAGCLAIDARTGQVTTPLTDKLPAVDITCLAAGPQGLWAGTKRGVWLRTGPGQFRYFASRRWLPDDEVVDLQPTATGDLVVLTRTGVARIEFRSMTLAQKAEFYQRKIRQRHLRYGFVAELRLREPGDPASAELIDTDNDGSWTSLYLASQAFRHAVTGEEEAREHCWETFATFERLQTINPLDGFPARTFERTGFKVSDPERWHVAPNTNWEWKAHTSSDEIVMHAFAYAVLYETVAKTPAEKQRVARLFLKIVDHLLRNDLYLVDVDGQPTLWGRWNPEYVNWYPPTIGDRRLNSAEITAFLQFAHHLSGEEKYKAKADELFTRHGYLTNITNSLAQVRVTPGYIFRGDDMGNEWNHSDDELAFYTYWVLHRYAFTPDLARLYGEAVRDHWQLEQPERIPMWSFIYAATGGKDFDLEGSLWTLRRWPLDLVSWTVSNSHRRDLTMLPPNFRSQTTTEVLPPDERPMRRWNGNGFQLDGGDGGHTEFAGDEFLLPYWMGRYLGIIR